MHVTNAKTPNHRTVDSEIMRLYYFSITLLSKYKVTSILPRNPKKHVADPRFILFPFSGHLRQQAACFFFGRLNC
jgi:hypothetical protein